MPYRRRSKTIWLVPLLAGATVPNVSCVTVTRCEIPATPIPPSAVLMEAPKIEACCPESNEFFGEVMHYLEGIEMLREADGDVSLLTGYGGAIHQTPLP